MLFTEEEIDISNYEQALEIYNSNRDFLLHHLGKDSVDQAFILNEIKEMKEHGFLSNIVYLDSRPIGILDYSILPTNDVYLSLLILDSSVQHVGLGRKLYSYLENKLVNKGATSIRIDVVNDYVPNLISFWESMGFIGQKEESLTWGDKTSSVLVMIKNF